MNVASVAAAMAVALLATTMAGPAHAQSPDAVIPDGKQRVVRNMVLEMLPEAPEGIAVERTRIVVTVAGGGVLTLGYEGPPEWEPGEAEAETPDLEAVAAARDTYRGRIWEVPPPPPEDATVRAGEPARPTPSRGPPVRTWWTLALAALAIAAGLRGRRPRRPDAGTVAIWAVALGFVGAAVLLPPWGPVHDHLSFFARAECAADWRCDVGEQGAWLPPTFHLLGPPLAAAPWSVAWFSVVSLTVATLALVAVATLTRRLIARTDLAPQAPLAGAATALALAASPAWLRLAVASPFWPSVVLGLALAALLALDALDTDRPGRTFAASAALAFAAMSNLAATPLAALAVIGPVSWRRVTDDASEHAPRPTLAPPRWRHGLALVPACTFVLAYAWVAYERLPSVAGPMGGVGRELDLGVVWRNRLVLAPGATPWPALMLSAMGLAASLRRRALWPVLAALALTEWILGAQVDLAQGYPTRFHHGTLSLAVGAAWAGIGAAWLRSRLPEGRAARAALAAGAFALAVGAPTASDAWAFARSPFTKTLELAAMAGRFGSLPAHTMLVVPPNPMLEFADRDLDSDPVGVAFPDALYTAHRVRAGHTPAEILPADALLNGVRALDGRPTLLYLGASFVSWTRPEIDAGLVPPDTVERPTLQAIRARFELVPVETFEVAAANPPLTVDRVAADRAATVTLGFYWLRPR